MLATPPTKTRTITPIGERVVVRPKDPPSKSKEGTLFIPEVAKEKPQEGTIVEISDDMEVRGSPLLPGLTVIYGKYSGHEIQLNDEVLLVLELKDVLGYVTEDDVE